MKKQIKPIKAYAVIDTRKNKLDAMDVYRTKEIHIDKEFEKKAIVEIKFIKYVK